MNVVYSNNLESNYCRNPSGANEPWCYTRDKNKRWEYCGVPACLTQGNNFHYQLQPESTLD